MLCHTALQGGAIKRKTQWRCENTSEGSTMLQRRQGTLVAPVTSGFIF